MHYCFPNWTLDKTAVRQKLDDAQTKWSSFILFQCSLQHMPGCDEDSTFSNKKTCANQFTRFFIGMLPQYWKYDV